MSEIKINTVRPVSGQKFTAAFVDVTVNGTLIKGCRVVKGQQGNFFSLPQELGKKPDAKTGKKRFYAKVRFEDQSVYPALSKAALEAYDSAVKSKPLAG